MSWEQTFLTGGGHSSWRTRAQHHPCWTDFYFYFGTGRTIQSSTKSGSLNLYAKRFRGGRGASRIFSRGPENFPCIVASRVRKTTLSKLFTMLQASAVLPHRKKLKKNRLQRCKSRNSVFRSKGAGPLSPSWLRSWGAAIGKPSGRGRIWPSPQETGTTIATT